MTFVSHYLAMGLSYFVLDREPRILHSQSMDSKQTNPASKSSTKCAWCDDSKPQPYNDGYTTRLVWLRADGETFCCPHCRTSLRAERRNDWSK